MSTLAILAAVVADPNVDQGLRDTLDRSFAKGETRKFLATPHEPSAFAPLDERSVLERRQDEIEAALEEAEWEERDPGPLFDAPSDRELFGLGRSR